MDKSSLFLGYVEIMQELVDVQQLKHNFNLLNYLFPRNPKTKDAFVTVCHCPDKNVNLHDINDFAP